ncbi:MULTISPECIES: TetR/AcrR family transcriptional regulator [Flavobacterium]|jgi:AcrR family transcriptional regulator|uniref:TetR family transcriptional regulator n=1 Tax=Flavobacterium cheniae TaxID=295428 RepID=A0A562KS08_9FLAO|nr:MULTISPECIES: TetR/AcrR family transcriptional regulator [Flavobacterium]TDR25586.1 TetR family transcriptional regulator [Flavobacterium cheniae]TWH98228.1 TetR family transcriptional regulator [Flavobacterium cheniae]
MTTEEKIFEAAFRVFQLKGFKGARMQEIADEAGINKAMLHYCFKNKELLFEAVFMNAFGKLAPQINEIFKSQDSIFEKIKKFTDSYISFVMNYPFLPQFIIQEMNNNPEFVTKFLKKENRPDPTKLIHQIENEIKLGILKPINPKQLLIDIFSMTVFPFAAQALLKGMIQVSNEEFMQLMEERKKYIYEQIITSIKK